MKHTSFILLGLSLLLLGAACAKKTATTTNTSNPAGTSTSGELNTSATVTVDGTGLIVSGSNKQNGDSLSPYLIFTVPVGVTSSEPLSAMKAENFRVNNLEAGGTCTTPKAADMSITTGGLSPGMSFSFECTTTGAYNEQAILDAQGVYESSNHFKYAGLQPKDINRTFSFDLVAIFPDGSLKRKTLTGSFDAAKVIEASMQNGATLDGLGQTM